ncbi:MAG: SBBP repeat-containing protein [Candidatus Brocadiaceae bacterium]
MTTLIYLFIQSFSNVSSQKISFARILSISALVSLLHPFLFYDIVPASAKPATDEALRKTQELQMPFIANEGQTDERVRFYANTAGGTVFVIKDGEIVYVLPKYEEKAKDVHHEAHEENTNVGRRDSSLLTYSNKSMEYGCNLAERGMAAWGQDENNPLNPPLSRGTKCEIRNPKSTSGVMLKEEIVGGRISTVKGEGESFTKISYFKGNDPSKWKNNITTYDMVDLGEIYKGVELKLQAHGNNVEKLFYVKPGADPNQIKISLSGLQSPECNEKLPPESPFIKGDFLSPAIQAVQTGVGRRWMHPIESRDITKSPLEKGARGLSVNEDGQLVAETALGLVKFTKPIAYQMIDGKRVEVECEYVIAECGGICPQNTQKDTKMDFLRPFESFRGLSELLYPKSKFQNVNSEFQDMKSEIQNLKSEYGFKVASYDTTKELIIDPLLASTFLGRGSFQHHSIAIDQHGNVYVAGSTYAPDFPTTSGVYDTSLGGSYDIFVSKLNGELTKLLASTYLGGTAANSLLVTEEIRSLAIDPDENIFVSGFTRSQDFPVTPGAYDTSFTSEPGIFISKLDKNLTKLLASTFFDEGVWGGSGGVIVIDKNGDVYVTGTTSSPNFPTTPGAFDTSINDSNYANASDAFVSKLKGDLTTLLVSTYLGGSNRDDGHSITIDSNGDVYVIGYTESSDFPVTPDAYNTTPGRIFVSKLNGDLTKLLASTIFGGNDSYLFYPTIALDLNGNVFVAGNVSSGGGNELPNFPTTPNAYDTSYNDFWDIFISKFSGDLKNLLASTYLGGTESDGAYTVAIAPDANGNIYITGDTFSIDFPTYEEPYHGDGYSADAFVSKLSGDLTELLESTNLGGTDWDLGSAIAMDTKGYVYVTGMTQSSDFPTTPGAYDTSPAKFDRDTRTFVTRFINTLHYCADELSISGISPKTGGNNGFVSALINGCQFQEGAKVKLVKDDQPAVWGDIVKLKNANYITTIFNLSGKETGLWDVVVVNPDGSSAILSEGFTVVEGKSPQVWVDVLARSFFQLIVRIKSLFCMVTMEIRMRLGYPFGLPVSRRMQLGSHALILHHLRNERTKSLLTGARLPFISSGKKIL